MTKSEDSPFAKYDRLRKKIDKIGKSMEKVHGQHLTCKKGCDLCCMSISVFPIEFYAIKAELDHSNLQELPLPENDIDCRYLVDHNCAIYPSRPVICRTHGLPLLYMSFDADDYELSCCELNFTDFDFDDFNEENTFPMDRINSQLYAINKEFVATYEGGKYYETDRISLAELV